MPGDLDFSSRCWPTSIGMEPIHQGLRQVWTLVQRMRRSTGHALDQNNPAGYRLAASDHVLGLLLELDQATTELPGMPEPSGDLSRLLADVRIGFLRRAIDRLDRVMHERVIGDPVSRRAEWDRVLAHLARAREEVMHGATKT